MNTSPHRRRRLVVDQVSPVIIRAIHAGGKTDTDQRASYCTLAPDEAGHLTNPWQLLAGEPVDDALAADPGRHAHEVRRVGDHFADHHGIATEWMAT